MFLSSLKAPFPDLIIIPLTVAVALILHIDFYSKLMYLDFFYDVLGTKTRYKAKKIHVLKSIICRQATEAWSKTEGEVP